PPRHLPSALRPRCRGPPVYPSEPDPGGRLRMIGPRVARLRREWNLQKVRALARYALRRAGEDRLPQVSASLTFTTVLPVVPVLTVAFALLAAFPVFRDFRNAIEAF